MTVGKKFALTGVLLMALSIALGSIALASLGGMQMIVGHLTDDALPGLSAVAKVEASLNEMRGDMLKHVGTSSSDIKREAEVNIQKLRQTMNASLGDYQKTVHDDENRGLSAKVSDALQKYFTVCESVLEVSRTGNNAAAYAKYENESIRAGVYKGARAAIQALADFNRKSGVRASAAATAAVARAHSLVWLLIGVSMMAGSALLFVIVRNVNRTLGRAVKELSEGAVQVARAAAQVSAASQSLAQGSSRQAASLEETSASMEEINSLTQKTTENSTSSASLFSESQDRFQQTNRSLEEMTAAMSEISDSTGKIAKIIKVIDEIAFQTNILALNAAVEAARAGEAGMGFAVVADEVRNLAHRCAQGARDTTGLIEDSIARSNRGKSKVDEVARAFRTITEDTARIKVLVDQVHTGSQEQARGMQQIGVALSHMEGVTQNTAAHAEESAAAAEQLTAQSEALKAVVQRLTGLISSAAPSY